MTEAPYPTTKWPAILGKASSTTTQKQTRQDILRGPVYLEEKYTYSVAKTKADI